MRTVWARTAGRSQVPAAPAGFHLPRCWPAVLTHSWKMYSCLDKSPFWETTETPAWRVLVPGGTRLETPAPSLRPDSQQGLQAPHLPALPAPLGAGGSHLYAALPTSPAPLSPCGRAGPTLVLSLVVVAGLVRDAVLMGVPPHRQVVAPLTGARVGAVEDVLHGQQGGGPRPLSLDVDPVCKGSNRAWSARPPGAPTQDQESRRSRGLPGRSRHGYVCLPCLPGCHEGRAGSVSEAARAQEAPAEGPAG